MDLSEEYLLDEARGGFSPEPGASASVSPQSEGAAPAPCGCGAIPRVAVAAASPRAPAAPRATANPRAAAAPRAAVAPRAETTPKRPSVYGHLEGLQEMGQMRGLRSDRRRARFRANTASRYSALKQSLSILDASDGAAARAQAVESAQVEEAQALVAAAIEDFALSVERIVARLEALRGPSMAEEAERRRQQETEQRLAAEARALRRRLQRALHIEKEAHAVMQASAARASRNPGPAATHGPRGPRGPLRVPRPRPDTDSDSE